MPHNMGHAFRGAECTANDNVSVFLDEFGFNGCAHATLNCAASSPATTVMTATTKKIFLLGKRARVVPRFLNDGRHPPKRVSYMPLLTPHAMCSPHDNVQNGEVGCGAASTSGYAVANGVTSTSDNCEAIGESLKPRSEI